MYEDIIATDSLTATVSNIYGTIEAPSYRFYTTTTTTPRILHPETVSVSSDETTSIDYAIVSGENPAYDWIADLADVSFKQKLEHEEVILEECQEKEDKSEWLKLLK